MSDQKAKGIINIGPVWARQAIETPPPSSSHPIAKVRLRLLRQHLAMELRQRILRLFDRHWPRTRE